MIGQVADVLVIFEGHGEGRSIVGFALDPSRGLGTAGEVVLVVTDAGARPEPVGLPVHSVRHREHDRLHPYNTTSHR